MARYLRRLSLIVGSFWIGCALQREYTMGQPLNHLFQHDLVKCPVEKPTISAVWRENTRSSQLSREEASSGKILVKDHVFSRGCKSCSRLSTHSFRESCRRRLSRDSIENHRRVQFHWEKHRCTSV